MTDQGQMTEEQGFELMANQFEEGSMGQVQISDAVIASIAKEAVLSVSGVAEIPDADLLDGIAGMIGKKSFGRGITVTIDQNDRVVIGLNVILVHGVKIPEVAGQLQQVIKDSVEDMTGKDVQAVNVFIQGIKVIDESAEG